MEMITFGLFREFAALAVVAFVSIMALNQDIADAEVRTFAFFMALFRGLSAGLLSVAAISPNLFKSVAVKINHDDADR